MSRPDPARPRSVSRHAEEARLAALHGYDILDSALEPEFDDIVVLVKTICRVPIALVSLVDADRQWFKARTGITLEQTALDTSVCALAIRQEELFQIDDLAADPRTAAMSLVTGEPGLRFYAGMPLVTASGAAIGSLCAIDRVPRPGGLSDEQADALRALARAVTAQIEVRAGVRRRERMRIDQLERLWMSSPDLLVILDTDGTLRRVNPAWSTLLGYEPAELVGRNVLDLVAPDDVVATGQALAGAADAELPILENRYRHRDGSIRWFAWVSVPTEDGIYGTGRHITREKDAQEQLRRTEDLLRQAQKVEALGQLTGGVAHDFNNLLTVIRGSVDLLRLPGIGEERRTRYTDAIAESADRAARLTGQLLAFARRSSLTPQVFDVAANLAALRGMIATLLGPLVVLEIDPGAAPCFVEADASQFDTAIVNIAANARDAMSGHGRLRISVERRDGIPVVRHHPYTAADVVAIRLVDDGAGIDPAQIDHIFEPFFTTKAVGQGTGLGLSQVFGFAKQSGGEIQVESRVGQGTTFTLYLPRVVPAADTPPAPDAAEGALPLGARVLVVEDNPAVAAFAMRAMAELGLASVLATDADAALRLCAEAEPPFDIVFSDVVMPGMNGIDLARELARRYPDLRIVLTSGYSTVLAQDGRHGFQLLHKPYGLDQLAAVLRKPRLRHA